MCYPQTWVNQRRLSQDTHFRQEKMKKKREGRRQMEILSRKIGEVNTALDTQDTDTGLTNIPPLPLQAFSPLSASNWRENEHCIEHNISLDRDISPLRPIIGTNRYSLSRQDNRDAEEGKEGRDHMYV